MMIDDDGNDGWFKVLVVKFAAAACQRGQCAVSTLPPTPTIGWVLAQVANLLVCHVLVVIHHFVLNTPPCNGT